MKIKKLTDLEKSKLRDQAALAALPSFTQSGVSMEFATKRAFDAADKFLELREENQEVVEMKCGCEEVTISGKDVTEFNVAEAINKDTFQRTKAKGAPKWAIIGIGLLALAGMITTIVKVKEFIAWVF